MPKHPKSKYEPVPSDDSATALARKISVMTVAHTAGKNGYLSNKGLAEAIAALAAALATLMQGMEPESQEEQITLMWFNLELIKWRIRLVNGPRKG